MIGSLSWYPQGAEMVSQVKWHRMGTYNCVDTGMWPSSTQFTVALHFTPSLVLAFAGPLLTPVGTRHAQGMCGHRQQHSCHKIKPTNLAKAGAGHSSFRLLATLVVCGCISRYVKLLAHVWMDQEVAERDEGRHSGMVPHTFKVDLLSVRPSWECPHG